MFAGRASKSDLNRIGSMLENGNSPTPLLGNRAVELSNRDTVHIRSHDSFKNILFMYDVNGKEESIMVPLFKKEDRDNALSVFEEFFTLNRSIEPYTKNKAIKLPLWVLGILTFMIFLSANVASKLANGEHVSTRGRRAGLKKLFVAILDLIGPVGVYIIGIVLCIATVYWMIKRIENPPSYTHLKK